MKFFWKIFFTTMFISVTCTAFVGYLLINSSFRTLLNYEAQTTDEFGEIVYYSLINELKDIQLSLYSLSEEEKKGTVGKTLRELAQSIQINSTNQKVTFAIADKNGSIIFSSLWENLDKTALSSLQENEKVWTLKKKDNTVYMQTLRPLNYGENTFYIENIKDVTFVFDNQTAQFQTLLKLMTIMLVFGGLVTYFISKLLVNQIISLTKVTKDISDGLLNKRVSVTGKDEISILSQNFNQMADDLEEKIHQLQEEAERKELFVGAFSHELKTPLTSIIGYADLLQRNKLDNENMYLCANYIFTEGQRLEKLSMKLLDLIVLKKQELQVVPTNLEHLLHSICQSFLPQLKQCHIALTCNIEPATIPLESDLMKTVFVNLIDNAKKAIDTNGFISIKGSWCQNGYILSIQDNGKGIDQQDLTKIKEAFYMVDKSRARKHGSSGLGLAICDEILKLHGFSIDFVSEVGVGTTVTLTMKGDKNEHL